MDDTDRAADAVQASAREWHRLQLAALGFVGLCGVLKGDAGQDDPAWLQSLSGALLLAALLVAVIAIVLVVVVAWPVGLSPLPVEQSSGRVRTGIWLTFVAVALTALASTSSWWPAESAEGERIEVTTRDGSACGAFLDSDAGWVDLGVDDRRTRVTLGEVVSLKPVSSC